MLPPSPVKSSLSGVTLGTKLITHRLFFFSNNVMRRLWRLAEFDICQLYPISGTQERSAVAHGVHVERRAHPEQTVSSESRGTGTGGNQSRGGHRQKTIARTAAAVSGCVQCGLFLVVGVLRTVALRY